MRWTATCVASLAVATCLCGAIAVARPTSPVGPARTATKNETRATQAKAGKDPATMLLGYAAVQSTSASIRAGRPESFRFSDQRSGSVSSIHVFIDSRNRATSLVAGLYSNVKGHPGSLLTAGVLKHPKAGAWNALQVASASVRSGHMYWLAVLGRGGRLYFRVGKNGRCAAQKARQTRMHSLRSSWTGRPAHSLCRISAYAARKVTKGTVNGVLSPVGGGGSNGGGTGTNPSIPTLSCDLNANTSNFTTEIAAASPGQVVCLASGDYSSFTGTSKSAPGIWITSAPGATVTFNSGFNLNLSSVQNFMLDGTGGGGTMTVGGPVNLDTGGGGLQDKALNLLFQNIAFTATADVEIDGPENSNITFNRDRFVAGNVACSGGSAGGTTWQVLISYDTATATTPSGVTIENSVFVAPADLWDPARAIQTASSMTVANNVFVGYVAHSDQAGCNHIDTLQIFSQLDGTWGGVVFTGNLCYFDYGCIMAFDGTSDNTVTDNVCFDIERSCATLYSDSGSVISHNTQQKGGADASLGCIDAVACTGGYVFENSHKTGDPVGSGETFSNNVSGSTPNIGDPSAVSTNTNNLYSGASSPNINGSATFTGGTNPITWAGFELTPGSAGHAAGSDGLNVGIRSSAGGPPTGGGSAPANLAAPALTGTATQGQTLTSTDGTWRVTGYVPTVTTYQWFDCPTSTFSAGSCTPIQPQTAPNNANNPTYTLQASDIGDYVFSVVTVTNANGQINATSNARGPVG
jgi:hypothetical protein